MLRTAPILLLLLTATGCWVPIERGRQMDQRISRLEVESETSARQLEEQRALVRDRVAKIDQKIDELNQAARRSGADLSVQVQRLQEEVAKLRGALEVEQHRGDELDKAVASLKTDTEGRLAALKGAGALDEFEARRRVSELTRPDDKNAFFALAEKEDNGGDKGVARELYQQYVKRWPTDPRAADAGARAGDLLFEAKRYREALLAYGKVAEDFPRADRAPDALFGAAESMVRLDLKDDARAIYGQVIEKYPKAPAARRAKERMQELWPSAKRPAKRR